MWCWNSCGSSPHTRGARRCAQLAALGPGIIPAYAGSTERSCPPRDADSDHPRIRGEHVTLGGSKVPIGWIIPAYAGSTRQLPPPASPTRDHPRIRGEHPRERPGAGTLLGSSPHTRGAPAPGFSIRPGVGIIPAYAGSTGRYRCRRSQGWDHPRIRGEHRLDIPWPQAMQGSSPHTRGAPIRPPSRSRRRGGSSPHTRGALRQQRLSRAGGGIIPAYAGSTGLRRRRCQDPRDHPRIRGEHYVPLVDGVRQPGSSPHTRGALDEARFHHVVGGIIPAYAGSTFGTHRVPIDVSGSSPHTRGARDFRRPLRLLRRIIPAYAGSTHRLGCAGDFGRDHPRIRGEHDAAPAGDLHVGGSSPHTRGARADESRHRRRFGIIPAYAGSTQWIPAVEVR